MHAAKLHASLAVLAASAAATAVLSAALIVVPQGPRHYRLIDRPTTVSIPAILGQTHGPGAVTPSHPVALPEVRDVHESTAGTRVPPAPLGGAAFPPSPVVSGGGNAQGFNGLDLVSMEKAGTGQYAGTNTTGVEPPDQALCVGNGFVVEGVNLAFQIFTARGVAATPPVPMSQFFQTPPPAIVGPASFLTDPRCIYDAATRRFFVSSLEADQVSPGVFGRSHNYFAVSKTSDPTKDWYLYSFDVTDDGLAGTPRHSTCPCLGDQPLIGADANGFYISDNEFSDAEIVPVQPPPAVNNLLNKDVFTLPDFRNGQAQVYALSKRKLISGQIGPVIQFDTATVPLPPASGNGAVWSSLQPAHSPPGDTSAAPAGGAEYFLSQLDFQMTGDHRIAVWAATNTTSLNSSHPSLALRHVVVPNLHSLEYTAPVSADQKAGPMPIGATCLPVPCTEEKLNANDDRMNEVMLTNGALWSAVNTKLAPINAAGTPQQRDTRTGILYFEVVPSLRAGQLSAAMVRDGYVKVPLGNVLFPSIAATPAGRVVMGFSLSGVDHYPSAAWAELDGIGPNQAPIVHVSAPGAAPEDGFTGYCAGGVAPQPLDNVGGLCTDGISRWGDYTFSVVDEQGCIWSGAEYISGRARDPIAGDWATFITRVAPPGCHEPSLAPR